MARKTPFALLLAGLLAACGSSGEDAAVGTWRLDTVATVTANHSQHRNVMMKIADELDRVAGVATGDRLRQDVAMEMPQVERELQAMAEADAQDMSVLLRLNPDGTLEASENGDTSEPDTGSWSRADDGMLVLDIIDSATGEPVQLVGSTSGDRLELRVPPLDPNDREDMYHYGLRHYQGMGVSEAFLRAILDGGEMDPYMIMVRHDES